MNYSPLRKSTIVRLFSILYLLAIDYRIDD